MWGGDLLASRLNRKLPEGKIIGEAWEICDRKEFSSPVLNGPLAGTTLHELIETYGRDLLGTNVEGKCFPLLVKLIDSGKPLSLQVHPDEKACGLIGGTAEPKTEMWYILAAKENAKIFAGLAPEADPETFFDSLNSPDLESFLKVYNSKPGDTFFIRAGLVHAIGAGNLLLEVQQNSDTTYRISDWGRLDSTGKPRELHVKQSKKCIDFSDKTEPLLPRPSITDCPFFRVEALELKDILTPETSGESFHLLTAANHPVNVEGTILPAGATCLIPACYGEYTIRTDAPCTVIQTRIP